MFAYFSQTFVRSRTIRCVCCTIGARYAFVISEIDPGGRGKTPTLDGATAVRRVKFSRPVRTSQIAETTRCAQFRASANDKIVSHIRKHTHTHTHLMSVLSLGFDDVTPNTHTNTANTQHDQRVQTHTSRLPAERPMSNSAGKLTTWQLIEHFGR